MLVLGGVAHHRNVLRLRAELVVQPLRRHDQQVRLLDQRTFAAQDAFGVVFEASVVIHAVIHQLGIGQRLRRFEPVRVLYERHAADRTRPTQQRGQAGGDGRHLVLVRHGVIDLRRAGQVQVDLEQAPAIVERVDLETRLACVHEIVGHIEDAMPLGRKRHGEVLRSLGAELPVDDGPDEHIRALLIQRSQWRQMRIVHRRKGVGDVDLRRWPHQLDQPRLVGRIHPPGAQCAQPEARSPLNWTGRTPEQVAKLLLRAGQEAAHHADRGGHPPRSARIDPVELLVHRQQPHAQPL
ncbi:hypothetical protein D3C71_1197170 [compost metagenome]